MGGRLFPQRPRRPLVPGFETFKCPHGGPKPLRSNRGVHVRGCASHIPALPRRAAATEREIWPLVTKKDPPSAPMGPRRLLCCDRMMMIG